MSTINPVLPEDTFNLVKSYLKRPDLRRLTTVNKACNEKIGRIGWITFQFQVRNLDAIFNSEGKCCLFRHHRFVSYSEGLFKIRHLNFLQRLFRTLFGWYEDTHLDTLTFGCNYVTLNSKKHIESSANRNDLNRLCRKIGKKRPIVHLLEGYRDRQYLKSSVIQKDVTVMVDEQTTITGQLKAKYHHYEEENGKIYLSFSSAEIGGPYATFSFSSVNKPLNLGDRFIFSNPKLSLNTDLFMCPGSDNYVGNNQESDWKVAALKIAQAIAQKSDVSVSKTRYTEDDAVYEAAGFVNTPWSEGSENSSWVWNPDKDLNAHLPEIDAAIGFSF